MVNVQIIAQVIVQQRVLEHQNQADAQAAVRHAREGVPRHAAVDVAVTALHRVAAGVAVGVLRRVAVGVAVAALRHAAVGVAVAALRHAVAGVTAAALHRAVEVAVMNVVVIVA